MRRQYGVILAAAALLVFASPPAAFAVEDNDITCGSPKVTFCFSKSTGLPLRLLAKPQSNIYFDRDTNSAQISKDVPAFSVVYAFKMFDVDYDKNNFATKGWFQVGYTPEKPEGYMRAEDVVLWKQALAVAFTNPGPSERRPVLMFSDGDALNDFLTRNDTKDIPAKKVYEDVAAGKVPKAIISREADAWVDIDKKFYLMPIQSFVDHKYFRAGDGDMFGLQVAAVTNQARSQQVAACDLQSVNAATCMKEQAGSGPGKVALDVVFVVDMTRSMQPAINAVAGSIRESIQLFEQKLSNKDSLKFGLVGYRDDLEISPGLEWVTKNFTPSLLGGPDFRKLLDSGVVKEATAGSNDLAEDVFAGMKTALTETKWSPDAAHIIILIGDASSHPVGDRKNSTGMSEQSIRELADKTRVSVGALFVGPTNTTDGAIAKTQFSAMAAGDGESATAFAAVDGGGEQGLQAGLRQTLSGVVDFLGRGRFDAISSAAPGAQDAASKAVLGAVRAAMVDYIGTDAKPPGSITAWVVDRDPTDFKKKAFDIKVMVGKGELQELMELLDRLLNNFRDQKTTSASFFSGLQTAGAATSYALPIGETEKFSNTDIVPRWIKSLPYKSEVLALSLEAFRQSSPDERTRLEGRLETLIKFYNEALNNASAWIDLSDQGRIEDRVYMLDLKNLP